MSAPNKPVRAELERVLEADTTRLGDVYRLTQRGLDGPAIAAELGVPTANFVVNNRTIARAILDGKLPKGAAIERVVAGAIRARIRRVELSEAARTHLEHLIAELDTEVSEDPRPQVDRDEAPSPSSLRARTDAVIRERAQALIQRIKGEAGIDADDYHGVVTASFALDHLIDLVERQASSRTTRGLASAARLDLSIEQAVIDWSSDLPLSSSMMTSAHGRLDYWRHA